MSTLLQSTSSRPIAVAVIEERLGVGYERTLLPVNCSGATALRDVGTGRLFAVQRVPAMAMDRTRAQHVELIVADLQPRQRLQLTPSTVGSADSAEPIMLEQSAQQTIIRNGRLAVRLPREGLARPPFPGPIDAFQLDGGSWCGRMALVDAPGHGLVTTVIESIGPVCVQWRTTYRWGGNVRCTWRVRWAAGSDTLLVENDANADTAAAIEWLPFGREPAQAWMMGGGEKLKPMQPMTWRTLSSDEASATADRGPASASRRELHQVGHIGYFHQWTLGWVGFTGGPDRFAGVFSGWASRWQRRGAMHMPVIEDDQHGHLLRLPVRRGRRLFGLVLCSREASDLHADGRAHLLNRRKLQWSDLALGKVRRWRLDPPLAERRVHLLAADDLAEATRRLAAHPQIALRLRRRAATASPEHHVQFVSAFADGDREAMRQCAAVIRDWADRALEDLVIGGYERLNIFHGRLAKRHAYTLDALWAMELIDPAEYRRIRRAMLAVAYAFSDPDFCCYEDYWPHLGGRPDRQLQRTLQRTMGNCPTPPNFASEFSTTVAVMAELFATHPRSAHWRRWGMRQLDRFVRAFVREDGTYCESINYHVHALNAIICQIYPLWHKQVRDYFAEPRIRGSFEHMCALQLPPIGWPNKAEPSVRAPLLMDSPGAPRAALPANGNSGSYGGPQHHKGELTVGAWVYRHSDPALSANLMHAWRAAGRPILDQEHPLLTLVTLDPSLPAKATPWRSTWRRSLGVVSKATSADGQPVWCLFRAGSATNHMDFDQGAVHLVCGDRVLLGDHGYHTQDSNGRAVHAAATWLHNTLTYAADKQLSSGYTGLEKAPEPLMVHLSDAFDWVVHRIVNTNYRHLEALSYRDLIPCAPTVHVRHYLFVKPDYVLLWDVMERASEPPTFWLHPPQPVQQLSPSSFRAGQSGQPHLRIEFLQPEELQVVENSQFGPLWSFGVRPQGVSGLLTLLIPQARERAVHAQCDGDIVSVSIGSQIHDRIILPPAGSRQLPRMTRRI